MCARIGHLVYTRHHHREVAFLAVAVIATAGEMIITTILPIIIMIASYQLVQAGMMTTMMITAHLIGGIGVVHLIMTIATMIKDGVAHRHHRAVVFQTAVAQLPIGN